jgi:hypothetical protein
LSVLKEKELFMEIPAANDKLREAEFFLTLMEKSFETCEFRYFVSAFLSALSSCTEHNRLHSPDLRFKDWYQNAKVAYLSNDAFQRLAELRNKEIHHKGTQSFQQSGMHFPDGLTTTTNVDLRFDLSSGKPLGRYKTDEMADFKEHPVKYGWVWKAQDEPDVMELCSTGLKVVRQLIQSRDDMHFQD